jgi:flavin reductase (DIM6/NTAB) family NADH-FMN oxidoreductase RutF
MIVIDAAKASRLINCGEIILVSAAHNMKETITPCAWHMPISRTPALIGVALAKGHFSSELIIKSKEFIINVPQWADLDKLMRCGSVSGRTADKFTLSGFTAASAHRVQQARRINECIGHIECILLETYELGDHYLFCGQVVYAQASKKYFINDTWDTAACSLIFHLGGKLFSKPTKPKEFKTHA